MAATLTADNELTWASFPIEKIEQTEDGNVLVWGKATDGSLDSDSQIVDPDFAAKAMDEFFGTGPNIRVQHQSQRDPAGVGISFERDGDAHWLKSKIIEPVAKQLVLGGALRAYSVGIARPTIQRDSVARGGRITDGVFVEVSLVDRPANKNCGIQLVKADKNGHAEWVGKVFGADDVITKITGRQFEDGDVTVTLPQDVQVSFSPLDLAKIVSRRHVNGFVAKDAVRYDGGTPMVKDGDGPDAEKRDFDPDVGEHGTDRDAMDAADFAGRDRSFPVRDASDVTDALQSVGRAGAGNYSHAKLRRNIVRIARRKGFPVPESAAVPSKKKAARKAAAVAQSAIPDMTKPVAKTDSDSDGKVKAMCLGCGAKQNSEHAFCTECGKAMSGAPAVEKNHDFACLGCGKDLDKGEKHCPGCGRENPGFNPMADLKIPANKAADPAEGSRVADLPDGTETAVLDEPVVKAKKGRKGKPFGDNQAPPFGKDKDGDADGGADGKPASKKSARPKKDKTADAPVTAVKGKGPGGKASGAITVDASAPGRRGKVKKVKGPAVSRTPDTGMPDEHVHPVPGHRPAAENQEFDRDTSSKFTDPAAAASMRLKGLGIAQDAGYAHDLVCPAFSWDQVDKAYPGGFQAFSADAWQQKALEAAASAPLAQAQAASQLGQAAFAIKSAALTDLADVKNDLYKAFRDANPGPGSFPTPGDMHPQAYQRPNITTGRAAYSHQYDGPNSAAVPGESLAASQFGREFMPEGRAGDSPANKSGAPYPQVTGAPVNLDYSSIHKGQIVQAFRAMHDHFDRVFPGVCPMNGATTTPPAHSLVPAQKSADAAEVIKKVSPDGMDKKGRKKLARKLTKKVMSGKMPLDQARIRMGKKPKTSPQPLKPQKSETTAAVTKGATILTPKPIVTRKVLAAELRRLQKSSDRKITALTKAVNVLADQPDPATQAFKGMALNPMRTKSASPAGVQSTAEIAERTQLMIMRELESTARNSTNSMEREAAWQQVLRMKGITP